MSEEKENVTPKSKTKLILIIAIILILALLGVIIFLLLRKDDSKAIDDGKSPRATLVTEDNLEEVQAELAEPVQDGYYEACMSVDWNFTDSSTPSTDAYVENVTTNTRTVYFDLTLDGTDELLYSSPFIPVGAKLDSIKLDKPLPAGDYAAIVTYHLVDDNEEELSTVAIAVTLHIAN